MKTLKIASLLSLSMALAMVSFAQTKSESIPVSGNCGMCKKTIEKAAKAAGATYASWNENTSLLKVSYSSSTSNSQKIQKAIAASGYDTQDFNASDNAYENLHDCCKYPRKEINEPVK